MVIPPASTTSEDDRLAKERLAHLVRDLRGQATQREFARWLGTSYTAVQDWEKQIRLPSAKNLKRIAELKGWTHEELIRYIFQADISGISDVTDPVKEIIVRIENLSQEQVQQLKNYLNTEWSADRKPMVGSKGRCLNDKQKHNLHLLLRASLKGQSPTEAMAKVNIDPPLFTDIYLRDDKNRVVTYEDLIQFSSLCCRALTWKGDRPPQTDCTQTYTGKTELLFRHLAEENMAEVD